MFDTRAITATKVVRLERLVADQAAVGPAEPPALSSNQPVGFELPGGAGDQDFHDCDGRDRKEHPDWAK